MSDTEEKRLRTWLERIASISYDPSGKYLAKEARKALDGEIYVAPPPIPKSVCSKCGMEDDGSGFFTIQVITNEGEEGFSDVTMYLCDTDLYEVLDAVKALGFLDHTHGGTAALQDDNCPGGYKNCPTPTSPYNGSFIVGNYELSLGKKDYEI